MMTMQSLVSQRGKSIHLMPDKQMQNSSVVIRAMRESDLEQVIQLDRLSFSMPWPESAFRYELFENPHSFLLVAADPKSNPQKAIAGAIVVWLILEEAHIATLAVHPKLRRKGIAGMLLAVALLKAIKTRARTATLEVRSKNLPAQELYRKFHFEVVGHRHRYYRDDNDDALIMTANLYQRVEQGIYYYEWIKQFAGKIGDM